MLIDNMTEEKSTDLTPAELIELLAQADPDAYEVYKAISAIRQHGYGQVVTLIGNGKIVNIQMTQSIKIN